MSLFDHAGHAGGGIEHLQALKVFHLEASSILTPIHSNSLEELHVDLTGPYQDRLFVGDLIKLRLLHIQMEFHLGVRIFSPITLPLH